MSLVQWINFPVRGDARGLLVPIEATRTVPFEIRRIYYLFQTEEGVRRGLHAHRTLRQVAICLSGRCSMLLDDGRTSELVALDRRDRGIMIEPLVWHEMCDFSPDCVLLVLANEHYDEKDYIRSRQEFEALTRA